MKKNIVILLLGIFLLSACDSASGIEVSNTWMRPAMKDGNGAVYFLLQNHSAGRYELTGVTSDAAQAVEMHESSMEGDVMKMQQVTSIPIPGKASIEFAPGGLHVMLIGLNEDLQVGDEIQVTLHFTEHEDILVTVPVQEMEGEGSLNEH
jgi:periplasmic copper chaperone A